MLGCLGVMVVVGVPTEHIDMHACMLIGFIIVCRLNLDVRLIISWMTLVGRLWSCGWLPGFLGSG